MDGSYSLGVEKGKSNWVHSVQSKGRARVPARREQVCIVDITERTIRSALGFANERSRGRDLSHVEGRLFQPTMFSAADMFVLEQRDTGSICLRHLLPGDADHGDRPMALAYKLLSVSATFVTPRLSYESRCSSPIRY